MRVFDQGGQEFIDLETLSEDKGHKTLPMTPEVGSMENDGQSTEQSGFLDALAESRRRNKESEESGPAGMDMCGHKAHQKIIFYGWSQRTPCTMTIRNVLMIIAPS